ncbi:MAG: peptide-binding protein [Candidatus Omnitrophica bacterium]|nr:peptide-binding protein [Candidatus Omnitrophota bacterium]
MAAFLFILSSSYFCGAEPCGDAYVTGSIADARNLIPFLATDTASSGVTGLVFNGLTKVDRDLNIVGDIAERWSRSEDGQEIIFFLHKNIKWHDGIPLTARDVKFTFEAILDPKNACPYSSDFMDIKSIDVIDDYTVRFIYSQPYAPAVSKLGMSIVPEHLLKGEDFLSTKFKRDPIGCGPYIFKEWKSDQHIILGSNKEYFEHRPYIDKYVTRVIPDLSVQYLELITGGIDSMGLTPYQYFYRTDAKAFKSKYNKYKYLSRSYSYIGYNLNDPLFSDKRVRQALSYAIDKNDIITGVLMGLGEPCTGPFFKETPYYNKNAEAYAYNKKKALELLREAGWADTDGDGILDKNGKAFRFKLITNQGNKDREDIATVVQHQWKEIGVLADVQIIAWASFLNEFVDKKNFQAVILGWTLPLDPDCYVVWHSASKKEGGFNFVSYKNEEVDALIEEGRRTFDKERRIVIYNRIHELIADDAPYTFLYFPYATVAVSKRFKGIDPAPAGIGYNFIDWYVDPGEVKYRQ